MRSRQYLAIFGATLALALCGGAWAETQTLHQRAELKDAKFIDAATVAVLEANTRIDILRRDGGWILVKAGARQGWLRNEALGAGAGGLLALENGRSGGGDLIATTGIRGLSKPPSAQTHALIMAIGAYEKPFELDGVAHDVDTARDVAHRMGVTDANLHVLRDGELTLDGMRAAFDALEASLVDNDQVFIYYSGHGGRQLVKEADGGERCAESLISVDGQAFIDAELEARLKRIAAKAQKVVMFIDACHSGGVTTRGVKAAGEYKGKSWNGKGAGAEGCAKPVNVLTRGIALAAKSAGSGGNNFAYIAAARDNEVSLDQASKGGVASQAWGACMAGAAKDVDGSGGLSVEEIRACAQARIDNQLRNATGFLPHHVTITGNPDLVLNYAAKEAAPEPSAPVAAPAMAAPAAAATPVAAPAVTVPPAAAPPVAAIVAPPAAAPRPSPFAALNDIYHNRDDRRLVTLTAARPSLRIGQDNLDVKVTSREAGYLYVMMVGSDGEAFDLLFPNQIDRNNLIQAGDTLRLPRPGWQLAAQGPAGKDALLAIVTDAPRDFAKAGLKPAGPFSVVEAVAAKDIQLVTATSAQADKDECSNRRQTRNIAVQKSCSGAYGAALLTIEEVAP
ncbi:MAG: caspase family protein [Rhodocyclaceae bacterium]|nr:caspase family protein [Rhodocyclaceae bacterium]